MSKSHTSYLLYLLLFSLFLPQFLRAEDLVGLKNLSWEEQKNKTRIILETTKPLNYNEVGTQSSSEIQVELSNLDLRNLPQELFINTNEVASLQTFPQSQGQKAKIVVKMTAFRPHQITPDGNKLYIDVEGNPSGQEQAAITAQLPPQANEPKLDPKVQQVLDQAEKHAEVLAQEAPKVGTSTTPVKQPEPAVAPAAQEASSPATMVNEVRVNPTGEGSVDVVLIGDGAFRYDVFELTNPQRLVIDLKAVSLSQNVQKILANGQDVFTKVRVAQYQVAPKVVRAVIDLNHKVPYNVTPQGKELRIHLGSDVAPAANTQDKPEQKKSEIPSVAEQQKQVAEPELKPQAPAEVKSAPAVKAAAPSAAVDNEQFFSFKPDTSLFAQQAPPVGSATPGSTTTSQPSAQSTPETSGGQGMGTFQERTVRSGQKQYTGEPFSFDFKDIDIKDLFRFIADISGLNVILDPSVHGSVTLKLTEVPWDQALDLITKNEGLGYTIEGNVIRIAPLSKITAEEQARRDAEKAQMLNAPLVTKVKPLSYAKATSADAVVKRLLTQKGSSIVDARTNTIIITDIDTNIDAVTNLLDTLDSRTAQVIIEARIVETTKSYSQGFGIQWGFRGIMDPAFGNNTSLQFPNNLLVGGNAIRSTSGITGNPLGGYAVNLPSQQAPNSALLLSAGNILDTFRLDLALMALESSGNGRILSSPKVATQNNTRAEIVQGTQIPVQTIANNTITTVFVQASLRLSVTPQITAEGTVIMEVEVENNRPNLAIAQFTGTPGIDTERAQTTLLVEDGGTAVIGGIFTAEDDYSQSRTPLLHRIPLLGWLFKNTNITRSNKELLIFLTPRIMR